MAQTAEQRERSRAYYLANRERIKAASAARRAQLNPETQRDYFARYYAEHAAEKKAYQRSYVRANHQVVLANVKAYNAAHPEMVKACNARIRARRRGAEINDLTHVQWEAVKALFNYRCAYCGKEPKTLTQDHIVPIARKGNHTVTNVVPACGPCNSRKSSNPPPRPVQPALLV